MPGFFAKERIIAGPGFNRWKVPPASVAIHLCIGSVYAWSIFNPALVRVRGVVGSAADDWTLRQVVWVFTVAIVVLGLSAAFAGRWLERVGPRTVGIVAALCWGGGFLIGSLGIALHQLWLLYFGYGVVGGCGLGLGYVSPVSTLIRWFPDRRGMAAGLAIMGFGGGAMIAAPLDEWLLARFYQAPEFLGRAEHVPLVTDDGKRYAEFAGEVLVIETKESKTEVPIVDVSELVLHGPASLTTPTVAALLREEIPVTWASTGGWVLGHTISTGHRNVAIRMAQYRAAFDERRCLAFARSLVAAKIRNARVFLRRNFSRAALYPGLQGFVQVAQQ